MSDLNINDLPRETIIQVLRYLDGENLKNATLTCKLWKNLIEAARRWSVTVKCHDTRSKNKEKMDFILTTDRKFGSIQTYGHLTEDNQILKMFQRHGFYLVKLDMYAGRLHNLTTLAKILRLTPNLKCIYMASIKLRDSNLPLDKVLPDLTKLKNLTMNECDHRIIKCFRKAKLSKIIQREDGPRHNDLWVDFLLTQNMLTSLSAMSHYSLSLPVAMGKLNVPIPFRLTQLAIFNEDDRKSSHDNIVRFVESQAKHLNHLELNGIFSHSVYECIFASMTQLKTLSVDVAEIPRDNDFYDRLKENSSVRTIKLLNHFPLRKDPFLPNFLKKLPNIHSLISPYGLNSRSLTMAQSADKVESLSVYAIDQRLIASVKFPNLHTLQIGELRSEVNWNEFTKIHCRLAELTIEQIGKKMFLTSDDIDQITTNVDLQTIRLGFGFNADDRFFEIIRTKCTNLKVLELLESCVSDELNANLEINVLRFCNNLPLDSNFLFLFMGMKYIKW